MEAVDVEGAEYEAWDSNGRVLELSVCKPKSAWLGISGTERRLSPEELAEIKAKAVPYRDPEPLLRSLGRVLGIIRN